ncbi:hypothetical protein ACP70R_020963 [Stipagrostis hirtigluma subsp. patula]
MCVAALAMRPAAAPGDDDSNPRPRLTMDTHFFASASATSSPSRSSCTNSSSLTGEIILQLVISLENFTLCCCHKYNDTISINLVAERFDLPRSWRIGRAAAA